MNILFVTRKYPPSKGGMENAAFELYTALAANKDNMVTLVKWGGANKLLPVVYPWLFVNALWHGLLKKPDVIYLQDGVMAPLGWMLKLLLRRPTLMTIHGKEATYGSAVYKMLIPPFIRKQDVLVAVSNDTKLSVQRAMPGTDPVVIFNGISDSFYAPGNREQHLAFISQESGILIEKLRRSKLLLTHGRLVRRKGVLWFVDEVMPSLVKSNPDVLYLVSGGGKDKEVIQAAIADRGMQDHVRLLGKTSDKLRDVLYNAADMFVMPNIPVVGDMEGFGLVALEAASCGTSVVASALEGIQDAIIDGKNGLLLPPGDAAHYVDVIVRELKKPSLKPHAVREFTLQNFAWSLRAQQYETAMQRLIDRK